MPHDHHGQELRVGDVVSIELTVAEIYPGAETCEVKLVRERPEEQALTLLCQAKQTVKRVPDTLRAMSSPDAPVGPQ